MIAQIHTTQLYRKPQSKTTSKAQFEAYIESVSKPSPSPSISKYLKAYVLTIITSFTLFYTVGPDAGSVNSRLIIRNNHTQGLEQFTVIKHLMSPMPWEN
jgi:hypothetical protein